MNREQKQTAPDTLSVSRDQQHDGATPFSERGFHTPHVSRRIEQALATLTAGEKLIVSTRGSLYPDNSSFLASKELVLMTFEKKDSRPEISVYAGLPSYNGTFIGRESTPLDTHFILSTGDSFRLGKTQVFIPDPQSLALHARGSTSTEQIGIDVANLDVGESLVIGRNTYNMLSSNVSRFHAVITRQNDIGGERSYILADGLPVLTRAQIQPTEDAPPVLLHGRVTLAPGARIFLPGQTTPITIPTSAVKPGQIDIEGTYAGIREAPHASQLLEPVRLAQAGSLAGTLYGRSMYRDLNDDINVAPAQAAILGYHIRDGLALIRDGKYDIAHRHFSNKAVLAAAGYTSNFGQERSFIIRDITPENIMRTLAQVARHSWFMQDQKMVAPAWGGVHPETKPQSPNEHRLLNHFHRELCQIYAEEWIHGYQHALNSNVSRKGALIDGLPNAHEIDVAQFMAERGVPLSYEFLHNRYPERASELEKLHGFQTMREVAQVADQIAQLALGENVIIGTDPSPTAHQLKNQFYQISRFPERSVEVGDVRRTSEQYGTLNRAHVQVSKHADGNFLLSAFPGADVFFQDDHAIWRHLDGPIKLEPGAKFRLGRYYQLRMPTVNLHDELPFQEKFA